MLKNVMLLILSTMLMLNLSGCFLFVAGAAGGGTAIWLSGKMTQEFQAPYQRIIDSTKLALQSLDLEIVSEKQDEKVTQIKSRYTDGKEIWIDIHRMTENSTKVEVRVGAVNSDKEASSKILKRIQENL